MWYAPRILNYQLLVIKTVQLDFIMDGRAMTCIFGAFRNRNKSYGFGDLCPWTQDLFEWNGLCSHSSLLEPIYGDFDLDPEHLEAKAAVHHLER